MFYNNSPYAKSGNAPTSPYKPDYASGSGLNQNPGGMQQQQQPWTPSWFNSFTGQTGNGPNNQGQQTPLFNGQPSSFTLGPNNQMIPTNPVTGPGDPGWRGGGGNTQAPTNPSSWKPDVSSVDVRLENAQGPSGGWTTVAGDYPNGVPPGTPAEYRMAVPAGPTMPRFSTGTSIGNGRDDPRRFMARPQLSMQQMQQLRAPYRPQAPRDDTAYTPPIYIQPDM